MCPQSVLAVQLIVLSNYPGLVIIGCHRGSRVFSVNSFVSFTCYVVTTYCTVNLEIVVCKRTRHGCRELEMITEEH